MSLTTGDDTAFGGRVDGDQVVLASSLKYSNEKLLDLLNVRRTGKEQAYQEVPTVRTPNQLRFGARSFPC